MAARQGFQRVVAAGGDGTINSVINGLYSDPESPPLAILPLGTGNDLCRSLSIPLDPALAFEMLEHGRVRRIDLVKATWKNGRRIFANAASGGNSNRVTESMTEELKKTWGAWAYVRGALEVLIDLKAFALELQLDDGPIERYTGWNYIVANGRTVAGGINVAPRAEMEDGLLDVIIIQDASPLNLATMVAEFLLGDYLQDERVIFRRASLVRVKTDPISKLNMDGELVENRCTTFTILPKALKVLVGTDYRWEGMESESQQSSATSEVPLDLAPPVELAG
jgi:diacylglycerol kinase (ATP)